MTIEFDPYHKWLGIPPSAQPANYYRLLGIEQYEVDLDVIDSAADQRIAFLRTFQTGPNGAASQQLLNEVSRARVCLVDSKKKAEYDARLRAEEAVAQQQIAAAQAGIPPSAGVHLQPAAAMLPVPLSTASQRNVPHSGNHPMALQVSPSKTNNRIKLLIAIAFTCVLLLTAIVLIVSGIGKNSINPETAQNDLEQEKDSQFEVADGLKNEVDKDSVDLQEKQEKPDSQRIVPNDNKQDSDKSKDNKRDVPNVAKADDNIKKTIGKETDDKMPEKIKPNSETAKVDAGDKSKKGMPDEPKEGMAEEEAGIDDLRITIPDNDQLEILNAKIDEQFGTTSAESRREQVELSRRLVAEAQALTDDPMRFALYSQAINLAAKADSTITALEVFNEMAAQFAIDDIQFKADLLTLNIENCQAKSSAERLGRELSDFVVLATEQERWQAAISVSEKMLVLTDAKFAQHLKRVMQQRHDQLLAEYKQWQDYQQSLTTLESDPADPLANLAAGNWLCFMELDWQTGLPMLALSNDETLKRLAETDLSTDKDDLKQLTATGDAWWTAAESAAANQQAFQSRAADWYELAIDKMPADKKDAVMSKRLAAVTGSSSEKSPKFTRKIPIKDPNSATLVASEFAIAGDNRNPFKEFEFVSGKPILMAATVDSVEAWNLTTKKSIGKVVFRDADEIGIQSLAPARDGVHFAGEYNGQYYYWNLKSAAPLAKFDTSVWGSNENITFSPDGKTIAGLDGHLNLIFWNAATLQRKENIILNDYVNAGCLKYSPQGDQLVLANDTQVYTMTADRKTRELPNDDITEEVRHVEFSPSGSLVAACWWDSGIGVWDLKNEAKSKTLEATDEQVYDVSFLSSDKLLVSVSTSRLLVWNVEKGQVIQSIDATALTYPIVAVSTDGTLLAAPGKGNTIQIYKVEYE